MARKTFTASKLIGLIGGIVSVVEAVYAFIALNILGGLLGLFLGLIIIASTGTIGFSIKIVWNWLPVLVIGIVDAVWGGRIGGIIIIIAAILILVDQ